MSDNFYHEGNSTSSMRSWVMWQMLRGMGYAALFVLAIGLVYGALSIISSLLPEESKQAPSPYSQLLIQPAAVIA